MTNNTQVHRITRRTQSHKGPQRFAGLWRQVPPEARAGLLRTGDAWGDARVHAALQKVPCELLPRVVDSLAQGATPCGHLLMRLSETGTVAHLEAACLSDLLLFLTGPEHPGFAARWRQGALRFGQHILRATLTAHVSARAMAERIQQELLDPRVPVYLLEAQSPWPRGVVCFGRPFMANSPSLGEWRRADVAVVQSPDPCVEAGWPDVHDICRCRYEGHRARISCAHAGRFAARLDDLLQARPTQSGLLRDASQALLTTGLLPDGLKPATFAPQERESSQAIAGR